MKPSEAHKILPLLYPVLVLPYWCVISFGMLADEFSHIFQRLELSAICAPVGIFASGPNNVKNCRVCSLGAKNFVCHNVVWFDYIAKVQPFLLIPNFFNIFFKYFSFSAIIPIYKAKFLLFVALLPALFRCCSPSLLLSFGGRVVVVCSCFLRCCLNPLQDSGTLAPLRTACPLMHRNF